MEQDEAVYGETFEVLFLLGRRRLYPRYPLNAPVEFVLEDEEQQEQAEGRDISLGGVGLQPLAVDESVPQIGSRVRLQIFLEGSDEPFNLEGEVVHADSQRGFGVRFVNLPANLRQRLKWLLTLKASD
jgi:hypothetical protein